MLAATALLLAVIGTFILAFAFHADLTSDGHRVVSGKDGITYVAGDRRVIRIVAIDGKLVMCTEAPHQPIRIVSGGTAAADRALLPQAALSALYLHEASWQICNAYANGAMNGSKYAALLEEAISKGSTNLQSVAGKHKGHQHRRRNRHRFQVSSKHTANLG